MTVLAIRCRHAQASGKCRLRRLPGNCRPWQAIPSIDGRGSRRHVTVACNPAAGQATGCRKHACVILCCTDSIPESPYSLVDAYRQLLLHGCMPAALRPPPGPGCRPQPVPTGGRAGAARAAADACHAQTLKQASAFLPMGCSSLATRSASQHAQLYLQAKGQTNIACMHAYARLPIPKPSPQTCRFDALAGAARMRRCLPSKSSDVLSPLSPSSRPLVHGLPKQALCMHILGDVKARAPTNTQALTRGACHCLVTRTSPCRIHAESPRNLAARNTVSPGCPVAHSHPFVG